MDSERMIMWRWSCGGLFRQRQVLRLTVFFLFVVVWAECTPPGDPIHCRSPNNSNCTITNSFAVFPDRTICRAAEAMYPTTEAEVISAVAAATRDLRKMKVATRFYHSSPKLACPDGEDGVLISTKYLNRTLKVDVEGMSITVEGGILLRQIMEDAAEAGLALPNSPYWWGLTIGGLISTGAHGSSLWGKGGAVHDYVVGIRMVSPGGPQDGYAKVRDLVEGDEDLDAAKVSLGVLGVITQVTLKLEPMFKRSITFFKGDDKELGNELINFGKTYEFGHLSWFPYQRQVVYRKDTRVPLNAVGNGLYDAIPLRSISALDLTRSRISEEDQESRRDAVGKCVSAKISESSLFRSAYGLTNDGTTFLGYPVIGYQNRIQASGSCLDSPSDNKTTRCPWDPFTSTGSLIHQSAISISLQVAASFLEDVKKLVELEPTAFCGLELYDGLLMRYVKASTAYLGKQEDGLSIEFTYYRSNDPMSPRLFEDVFEEMEQMAVFKYGGLPHWGKNRVVAFQQVIHKYRNRERFLKVKKAYDPQGLFSSEWTDQMLGLQGGIGVHKGDGCALDGLCICSTHNHCAPNKGYFCRPGKVYKEARVCSYLGPNFA